MNAVCTGYRGNWLIRVLWHQISTHGGLDLFVHLQSHTKSISLIGYSWCIHVHAVCLDLILHNQHKTALSRRWALAKGYRHWLNAINTATTNAKPNFPVYLYCRWKIQFHRISQRSSSVSGIKFVFIIL